MLGHYSRNLNEVAHCLHLHRLILNVTATILTNKAVLFGHSDNTKMNNSH